MKPRILQLHGSGFFIEICFLSCLSQTSFLQNLCTGRIAYSIHKYPQHRSLYSTPLLSICSTVEWGYHASPSRHVTSTVDKSSWRAVEPQFPPSITTWQPHFVSNRIVQECLKARQHEKRKSFIGGHNDENIRNSCPPEPRSHFDH